MSKKVESIKSTHLGSFCPVYHHESAKAAFKMPSGYSITPWMSECYNFACQKKLLPVANTLAYFARA
jgi:hypothetical protein